MKKLYFFLIAFCSILFLSISSYASTVDIFVDAAPNVYGSSDYEPWKTSAFQDVADGTFTNMRNGFNPINIGTTNFEIQDEVVYSFGDLGKRLTWIYWVEGETTDSLISGGFEISLINTWNGDVLDFYDYYYGSTWLQPTKWENYDKDDDGDSDGVIGTAGMAWWGAYGVNTQEALDADIASWITAEESWEFRVRFGPNDTNVTSLTSYRAPIPEPATMLLFGVGLLGIAGVSRRKMT